MAKRPSNADRVVIGGTSCDAFDCWLLNKSDILLADLLSGGARKTKKIVAERRRVLKCASTEWRMRRVGGEVLFAETEYLLPSELPAFGPISHPVLARLLGYHDHSAVTWALHQIRERERQEGGA